MSIRKALLVGINDYKAAPLRGCVNDVMQVRDLLKQYYGFADEGMKVLLDADATAEGIKAGLAWLAEGGAEADAVRVFHYSGHGAYVVDTSGDEPDGRDEALVPYDYKTAGKITDDTLKTLYDQFPRKGNLTLLMDCCHSGSIQKDLDSDVVFRFLPTPREELELMDAAAARYAAEREEFVLQQMMAMSSQDLTEQELREKVRALLLSFDKKRFGDIRVREANILLAGCRPDQTSADAKIGSDYHGAFTYYLVEAVTEANGEITYSELAKQLGQKLDAAHFTQVPQLEYRGRRNERLAFRPFL